MKAKDLKVLRKKIEKADRLEDPLSSLAGRQYCNYLLEKSNVGSSSSTSGLFHLEPTAPKEVENDGIQGSARDSESSPFVLNWFKTWHAVQPAHLFHQMMDLFQQNMGAKYKQSSWGLNLDDKKEELQHRKARFLVVTTSESRPDGDSTTPSLVAFCHYRFDYDDDQSPSCVALYLYEIQVSQKFQSMGIGRCLMDLLSVIAKQASMQKIMLTVFRANQQATAFYRSLEYRIDEISPTEEDNEDYEILCKTVELTPV